MAGYVYFPAHADWGELVKGGALVVGPPEFARLNQPFAQKPTQEQETQESLGGIFVGEGLFTG